MEAKISVTFSRIDVHLVFAVCTFLFMMRCRPENRVAETTSADTTGFRADVTFLEKYTSIITLESPSGKAKVAVSPALQGRVMTSSSDGDNGLSFGWINRKAFLSGDTSEHMNAFGGEDRFWLGPEGGQYSIYFSKGAPFEFEHWHVPRLIDLDPFDVGSQTASEVTFSKTASLTNYSGTNFDFRIDRNVRLISAAEMREVLGLDDSAVSAVGYESINKLTNTGSQSWRKETGLLSIWILGMYNPSDGTTVVIPHTGQARPVREIANDNYFGTVPDDRLKSDANVIYFRADGRYRSKIGLSPAMATPWMGSYDADNSVLTLVKYSKPANAVDYVNSAWEIQKEPYKGDVINSYNDGAPSPGVPPMGPFYELESSSPAAALRPGESITHTHTTFHIRGTVEELDAISSKILGVTIAQINAAFRR